MEVKKKAVSTGQNQNKFPVNNQFVQLLAIALAT